MIDWDSFDSGPGWEERVKLAACEDKLAKVIAMLKAMICLAASLDRECYLEWGGGPYREDEAIGQARAALREIGEGA